MYRIASSIHVFLFTIISLVTATNINFDGGFDADSCLARTLAYIDNGTLATDDEVFFRDSNGWPMVGPGNVTLTLPGCRQLCGPHQAWYWDIGPRLSTWLIPILLLLSNVDLSPLDKRRFMAIIHLVGDPIDSLWSLIHKIDAWDRCYFLAGQYNPACAHRRKVIATVFAGFEEIEGPRIRSKRYFDVLAERSGLNQEDKFREWRRTASELADSRTDEFLRTCLAIFLYIYQVIAGFVPAVGGGNTSPPGGRIGTAMFISWLVSAVLLSNVIGGFTSRRSSFTIMSRFCERTGNRYEMPPPITSELFRGFKSVERTSSTPYFESLSWSTAIYTFRTSKTGYINAERDWRRTALILSFSILPIFIGTIGGFIIIWYTDPIGFNCRHLWLIGIFIAWFVSVFVTWFSYTSCFTTGKYHWRFVLIKDACIAISSIIVIFLSSSGLFNSCFCWSGFYYYHGSAHVPLNVNPFYDYKDGTMYPAVVAICLFLQIFTFALIARSWREGLRVMRWGEKTRHKEWERARNVEVEDDNGCCVRERENGNPSWGLLLWGCGTRVKRWIEIKRRKRQEKRHESPME
jgi:hypothetical protein